MIVLKLFTECDLEMMFRDKNLEIFIELSYRKSGEGNGFPTKGLGSNLEGE